MSVPGHDNLEHANPYSRNPDQAIMVFEAMDEVDALFARDEPHLANPCPIGF